MTCNLRHPMGLGHLISACFSIDVLVYFNMYRSLLTCWRHFWHHFWNSLQSQLYKVSNANTRLVQTGEKKNRGEQIVTWLILKIGIAENQLQIHDSLSQKKKNWGKRNVTWLVLQLRIHDSFRQKRKKSWGTDCDMTHSGNGLSWLSTACTRLIQTKENRIVGNKLWRDSFFNCEWPLADTQLSIVTWPIQEKNCDMTRSVNCDMTPVKKVVNRLIL